MKKKVKSLSGWAAVFLSVAAVMAVCICNPDSFLHAAEKTAEEGAGPAVELQELNVSEGQDSETGEAKTPGGGTPEDAASQEEEIHIQVIPVEDEEVPLASAAAVKEHVQERCVLHFVLLAFSAVIFIGYMGSRRKHAARILTLTRELEFEKKRRGRE